MSNPDYARAPEKYLAAVDDTRRAVAARAEGVDQSEVVMEADASLEPHVTALQATLPGAQMFAEGWRVARVDLTRVCGYQPIVVSESALERVEHLGSADPASVAALALPLTSETNMRVQLDAVRQSWIVTCDNPNLRVLGTAGPVAGAPGGAPFFGFGVGVSPSYLQVVRYRGRHFLRDGYHRSYGFLSRGITVVPAFVRDMQAFEEVVPDPRVMLPQDAYQGARPPLLVDYLDDTVSASVRAPAVRKMVVIQALELTPIG
jgi:hypothetical protein